MVLFKELCYTVLTMPAECISSLTHRGLVYVTEILPKDKKKEAQNSTKLLKETKPQKPQSKIDLFSLRNFHTFPRTFMQLYSDSLAPQPRARNSTVIQVNCDSPVLSRLQGSPASEGWPVRPITLSVPLRGKQKKTPNLSFCSSFSLSSEKTSHKGMNKHGTSLSLGSPVQANAHVKTVYEARSAG